MPYMKRHIGRIDWVDGAVGMLAGGLPREHFYNRLLLSFRLDAQPSTSKKYTANAQREMATNIEIQANGQLSIKSFSQYMKYCNNWLLYGSTALELGAGVAADNTARRCDIIVEFGLNTADVTSVLPSFLLSSLDLRITWAGFGAMDGGGAEGILAAYMYCDVYSLELINQGQDARAAIINKETVLRRQPTAVGYDEFALTLGNVYRLFHLQTQGGVTAVGYYNNTVTDIEVLQDGVVFHRRTNFNEFLSECAIESAGLIEQGVAQPVGAVAAMAAAASMPAGNILVMFDYQNFNAGGSSNPIALERALPHLPDSSKMATWRFRANVPDVTYAIVLDLLSQELIMPKVRRG